MQNFAWSTDQTDSRLKLKNCSKVTKWQAKRLKQKAETLRMITEANIYEDN